MDLACTPKLDYYNNTDFGWGKLMKFEFIEEPLTISRCKDSKTDLKIGIVLHNLNPVGVFPSSNYILSRYAKFRHLTNLSELNPRDLKQAHKTTHLCTKSCTLVS